jgi:hypothetical protein
VFSYYNSTATTLKLLDRQGPPGSYVKVPVTINDAQGLAGVEFVLQYDPAVLDFISIDTTAYTQGFLIESKNKADKIAVSMARADGKSYPKGTLLYITFRILPK